MTIKVTDLKFNIDSTFLFVFRNFFRFNIFFIVTTFNHFRFAYVIFSRNWAGKTDVALTEKSYLRCHRDELCTKSIFTLTLRHFLSKSFNYFAFNNRIEALWLKMGLTISSLFNRLFGKRAMRILMGKVTLNVRYPMCCRFIFVTTIIYR